jgi:branched-chain amino acid transport system ATP-binding protein
MTLLKVSNIETYYGPIMAIKGVSLEVEEADLVTILGANGAGKSTILKTISGVMDPEKGVVEFKGQHIERMDPAKVVRLGISNVPEGREIFYDLSVKDNLMMGTYVRKDHAEIKKDLVKMHGYFPILRARSTQLGGSLSGGEQQMLAIARALMARPSLLLMDEASLGLSPIFVKEIFSIVKRINKEQNTAILMVEQNAKTALSVARYGYILELGRMVMADTCAELLQNEDVKEFYLGVKGESVRGQKRWKRKKKWR